MGVAAIALVIVGCTAGTDTTYVNAGFQDQPPGNPLQDGVTGTPQSGDPAPIVQGLTVVAPAQSQQGQGQQQDTNSGSGTSGGKTPVTVDSGL